MSAISGYINQIQNAVYGEQVRSSIVNALLACYSDVNSPSLQTAAFSAALNEAYAGGILDIQTVTSFNDMTNDKIIYRYNGTAAGKQKGLYYYSALSNSWVLIGSEIQKVSLLSQMTDVNDIYKYIGTESGMVQNSLYCHNGTAWVPIGSGVLNASTASQMTNTDAIYKYTGSESGYSTGSLYYYNGTAWTAIGMAKDGFTDAIKSALIDLFESVAYVDSDGQDKINMLKIALGIDQPSDELAIFFNSLTYLGGKAVVKDGITNYIRLSDTSARMAMSAPIENDNYIFNVVDPTKYSLAVYDVTNLTPISSGIYQGGAKSISWQTTTDSVTTTGCWVSFKKNDGTEFSAAEIESPYGVVFTVSDGS